MQDLGSTSPPDGIGIESRRTGATGLISRLPSAHFPLKLSRFPTQTQHASVVALSVASEQSCVLETVVNSNSDTERVEWVRGRYTGMEVVTVLARSGRSEEHTSELQSLMRSSYAVFCLKKKNKIVEA